MNLIEQVDGDVSKPVMEYAWFPVMDSVSHSFSGHIRKSVHDSILSPIWESFDCPIIIFLEHKLNEYEFK